MPANPNSLGALPFRFRRQRILIMGSGDVGARIGALLRRNVQVIAVARSAERLEALRQSGLRVLQGDLDDLRSIRRLAGVAHRVVHLAPPPANGQCDARTAQLLQVLSLRSLPSALVYVSTTGVYGDCKGDWVSETRMAKPTTPRAQRRLHAERSIRSWGRRMFVPVCLLRAPGIYAPDREGGTPWSRLANRTPVLLAEDDIFTNHIHADDLARACVRALWLGRGQRAYNVNDDTAMKMGEYLDWAADHYGLERPPRQSWEEIQTNVSPTQLSFMRESRRLSNVRIKAELRWKLRFPTVKQGLQLNQTTT